MGLRDTLFPALSKGGRQCCSCCQEIQRSRKRAGDCACGCNESGAAQAMQAQILADLAKANAALEKKKLVDADSSHKVVPSSKTMKMDTRED